MNNPPTPSAWAGWLLPIGFALITIALLASPARVNVPVEASPPVGPGALDVVPLRVALHDPPHSLVNGALENCNACHQVFESTDRLDRPLSYHQEITLSHGLNNRCLNCHDSKNRERLTLRDGSTVSFSQTPQLCSQCHGTVFRDWERGTHGKTLGSWVTGSPYQTRLSCNQCHDPHSPRYEPMAPLPGPRTLRMGEPRAHQHLTPSTKQSPLQRVLREANPDSSNEPNGSGGHP